MRYFPPILPSLEEEYHVLAHLYAYFDESENPLDHPVVACGGFVSSWERWRAFQEKWLALLRHYRIREFHTVEAVKFFLPYGEMKPGTSEERTKDLLPFVDTIVDGLDLGVVCAVDVADYKATGGWLHEEYTTDPHYFAVHDVIATTLNHFEIPKKYSVGLIFDEHEGRSMEVYKLLRKLRLKYPEVKERVVSICFNNDPESIQNHAADFFAYLCRAEAQQKFFGKPYPYHELFARFATVSPTGGHLHFPHGGRFFTKDDLFRLRTKPPDREE